MGLPLRAFGVVANCRASVAASLGRRPGCLSAWSSTLEQLLGRRGRHAQGTEGRGIRGGRPANEVGNVSRETFSGEPARFRHPPTNLLRAHAESHHPTTRSSWAPSCGERPAMRRALPRQARPECGPDKPTGSAHHDAQVSLRLLTSSGSPSLLGALASWRHGDLQSLGAAHNPNAIAPSPAHAARPPRFPAETAES